MRRPGHQADVMAKLHQLAGPVAEPHASMPIRHGGRRSKYANTSCRRSARDMRRQGRQRRAPGSGRHVPGLLRDRGFRPATMSMITESGPRFFAQKEPLFGPDEGGDGEHPIRRSGGLRSLYSSIEETHWVPDVLPREEFCRTRFFQEWLLPQGLMDGLFATVDKSATDAGISGFGSVFGSSLGA